MLKRCSVLLILTFGVLILTLFASDGAKVIADEVNTEKDKVAEPVGEGDKCTQTTVTDVRSEPNVDRFGFIVTQDISDSTQCDIASLYAGWYWDRKALGASGIPPLDYVQTIRLSPIKSGESQVGYTATPTGTELLDAIAEHPGSSWLIGDQPDCNTMNNMLSEWYAQAYHNLYDLIKNADPTAEIGAGNIVQPTPLRMNYLDRVLDTYSQRYGESLPADFWATGSKILCENCYPYAPPGEPFAWGACYVPDWPYQHAPDATFYSVYDHWDVEIFAERILAFRQWMYDRGYRNHPLVISEMGTLFYDSLISGTLGLEPVPVNTAFMYGVFDWMLYAREPGLGYGLDDDHLVQRWAWYSLDHGDYPGGCLFDLDSSSCQPTYLGKAYADYTSALSTIVAPETLSMSAPSEGFVNKSYRFTVTVRPFTVTKPLTYTWQSTDNVEVYHETYLGYTDLQSLSWDSPGKKLVSAWVTNTGGTISITHEIAITHPNTEQLGTDLSISKEASSETAFAGDFLTYTLTISNHGPLTTTVAKVTDTLPMTVTYIPNSLYADSGIPAWKPGDQNVTWSGEVFSGTSVVIRYAVQITTTLTSATDIINIAKAFAGTTDPNLHNNSTENHITANPQPSPDISPPELVAISNPDEAPDYLVEWTSVTEAFTYTLEEDDNADFSSPIIRHIGPNTQYQVTNQGNGTWYYRVKAANAESESVWSNQQSVTVTKDINNVYLPLVLKNYPKWDTYYEENDHWLRAYGPLVPSETYFAYPDDADDYYYVELPAPAIFDTTVNNFSPTSNNGTAMLYGPATDQDRGPLIEQHGAPDHSTMKLGPHALGAGKYYIRVYVDNDDFYSTEQQYSIRVTYWRLPTIRSRIPKKEVYTWDPFNELR